MLNRLEMETLIRLTCNHVVEEFEIYIHSTSEYAYFNEYDMKAKIQWKQNLNIVLTRLSKLEGRRFLCYWY